MTNNIKLFILSGALFFLASCATSMTPIKVYNTLPQLTKSKLVSQSQADEAIKNNKGKYLTRGRTYVAPVGLGPKSDLKKGAEGIDGWVKLDGGNAYVLTNYKWITVDHNGTTQLNLEFDTILCE